MLDTYGKRSVGSGMKRLATFVCVVFLFLVVAPQTSADELVPGLPPTAPNRTETPIGPYTLLGASSSGTINNSVGLSHKVFLPAVASARVSLTVNTADRQSSARFYHEHYLSSEGKDINWTGSHATCDPGTTGTEFREAVLERVNYYRAMAGVPADIIFSTESNQKAQSAALMMSVNRSINHSPPLTWTCHSSDGAVGAGSSNLALGSYGWDVISAYVGDCGDNNYSVGHRRWILYPQTRVMGTGDIPPNGEFLPANALRVFDSHMWEPRPQTRDGLVAWPPPGYVPYQTVFARWSFSYPGANFLMASIRMTSQGVSLPVRLEPTVDGYGENTLVWIPSGLSNCSGWNRPTGDTVYSITVRNVLVAGIYRDFSYDVIVFDPET